MRQHAFFLTTMLASVAPLASAADWPQWRHDANRSGASEEQCSDEMTLQWVRDLGRPDPAYDHQYRMCADAGYSPVAAGGKLFIPSNRADSVTAFDLASGDAVWRYVTEGPARMAPLVDAGRVYFGSDDGHLYCVDADQGALQWRVRGVPDGTPDSRMLVNGRIASRWPVRGAPVVHQGVVYFGCGLWPEEGVYVCAVDAGSGEILWRNDRLSYLKDSMSDHGKVYDLGLPPQGYLAVIDGKLAVPSGRSLAAWFDLETGEMEPYSCFYVKLNPPRGTWYLSGIGQYSVQGGNWFGTRPDALPSAPPELEKARSGIFGSRSQPQHELDAAANRPFFNAVKYALHNENLYPEPVLTETTAYASEFDSPEEYLVPRGHTHVSYPGMDRIVARDLTKPKWVQVPEKLHHYPKSAKIRRIEFPVLWEMETPLRVLIKAGNRLYAGEDGTVVAIAIPESGEAAEVVWRSAVDGNPVNALAASGQLIVTTDTGKVYCFGMGAGSLELASDQDDLPSVPSNAYALCLGTDTTDRARALAETGSHRVVVLEPDPNRAAEMRQSLAEEGIEADDLQVIHHTPTTQLTPYWADLVLMGASKSAKDLTLALNAMRPVTGRMELLMEFASQDVLRSFVEPIPGYELRSELGRSVICRTAPVPGSADWTHEAGGPTNTFSSSEELVRWPLATLWYSGDIDRFFTPAGHFQHERHPYPLVTQGRMFIITYENLHAIDIYTGRYLWKTEMPITPWVEDRHKDSRVYGRPVDRNYVATDDSVYVILEEEIHVYSAKDGSKTNVLTFPEGMNQEIFQPRWTEVRIDGNLLYAVLDNTLVALNRHTGELVWKRESTLGSTTFAIGDGRVIGLDYEGTEIGGRGRPGTTRGPLFALDAKTGQAKWSHEVEYDSVPKHTVDHARPWMLPPNPELAYNAKHRLIVLTARRNSVHAYRAEDGELAWKKAGRTGNFQRTYSPVVTDDHLVLSEYNGFFGYVLDVQTGEDRETAGIPRPRTCARIIGNNNLLVYRDAATELYDIASQRMIGLNSVRSGCTTSFIPAGGILTAPMLGHGCVCNYPMFASQALYHTRALEPYRPKAVVESWKNQAEGIELVGGVAIPRGGGFPKDLADLMVDQERFELTNATMEATPNGVLFSTKDDKAGYAIRKADKPMPSATFRFAVRRAGAGRHGNAFFVCGPNGDSGNLIECRLYYGGRSSLMIAGTLVEEAETKVDFRGRDVYEVTVRVDCNAGTVTLGAMGQTVTAKFAGDCRAITHYGYGGGNSDNLFTAVLVQ
jgi:outer membrane protein assembly factor BamB